MEPILTVKAVSKKFKQQVALKNVSLTLQKGDIYGLIGQNSAGKTTLLKIITRLSNQTTGEIQLFNSTNETDYIKNLKRTGSVIETPVAYDQLSASENLAYYCRLRGIVEVEDIEKTLALVGLAKLGKKKYKDFSLGMKQKLGIAIALLGKPDLLILDEPINGLDPIAIVEFRDLLNTLNREYQMTILISSHILTELYHVANRFGIIHEGELLEEITKQEFDEICREVVQIELDQPQLASTIIQEQFDCQFKITSKTEMNLYNYHGEVANVVEALVNAGVRIQRIQTVGTELETYFTQLIDRKSHTSTKIIPEVKSHV